ncbi:hypothetical protein ACHQM5_013705 [Ranunculus cassubicifolius]
MATLSHTVIASIVVLLSATLSFSQRPQVPGFFIFGDSLVDNGNNNRIVSLARANYMPYGIDFPLGTTGRFTNGRTTVDVLGQLLGFPTFIPPYTRSPNLPMLRGANYASGASGIRSETGDNLGEHMSMNQQLENFALTVTQMRRAIFSRNETGLVDHLSKCIFYVGMGSNDYLNNYYMPNMYNTSSLYGPKAYADVLIHDYARQLTELYKMGARKFIVAGVGQIGCIPYQLARYNAGSKDPRCNEAINSAISLFNSGLLNLVNRFNSGELTGAKFVYANTYKSSIDLVEKAASYGFEVVDNGCCGVGRNNGVITCLPTQRPCANRKRYIFWDSFHPTEAANIVLANTVYNSTLLADVQPINVQQLAML